MRSSLVDNFFPTIISGRFRLHRYMWEYRDSRKIQRLLDRGYFLSRVQYSMVNPIKESILEKLVQFLRINTKTDGKSRPPMALISIFPASVISSIAASTEKTHPVATICQ
jgi:hypothetical protein